MPDEASRTETAAEGDRAERTQAGDCAPDTQEDAKEEAGAADVRGGLEDAARDLLFLSESESPFEYVELPDAPAELTPQAVAAAVGEPDARVETRSVDDWLSGHIERADPADPVGQANVPRYRALREALKTSLADVQVFRVGEPNVRYYALGRTPDGRVAGLVARALET